MNLARRSGEVYLLVDGDKGNSCFQELIKVFERDPKIPGETIQLMHYHDVEFSCQRICHHFLEYRAFVNVLSPGGFTFLDVFVVSAPTPSLA
jgi:hypothetical protein